MTLVRLFLAGVERFRRGRVIFIIFLSFKRWLADPAPQSPSYPRSVQPMKHERAIVILEADETREVECRSQGANPPKDTWRDLGWMVFKSSFNKLGQPD